MKKNIKKILTATAISAISITTIGCSSNNNKLAKNIDNSMAKFVSSVNNLDYVETTAKATSKPNSKFGKIVETAAGTQSEDASKNKLKVLNAKNDSIQFINNKIDELEIENTITRPNERTDNFKLYILSESPYVTFSSDDNSTFSMSIKFSTDKIEETSSEIESKINTLILKRSILMIYVNEIYNGNVNFTEDNKVAINAYVNVIKENTSFLNGNRGMVKNQLGLATDLVSKETNENLVNYYIIKSGEALETRANKLDSSISAIDSIIKIIETSLTETSSFYNSNISSTYDKLISSFDNNYEAKEITKDSNNKDIADSITNSLKFGCCESNNTTNITNEPTTNPNNKPDVSNNTPIVQNLENKNSINNKNLNNSTIKSPTNTQNNTNPQKPAPLNNNISTLENRQRLSERQKLNNSRRRLSFNNRRLKNQKDNPLNNAETNDQNNNQNILNNNNTTNQMQSGLSSNNNPSISSQINRNNRNRTIQQNNNGLSKIANSPFRQNNNQSTDFEQPAPVQNLNGVDNNDQKINTSQTNETQKIMRAERTPKNLDQEKYTSSNIDDNSDNGIIRLPFVRN